MYQLEDILEGARSIRPYLAELLTADADAFDQELAALLAQAQDGKKVDNRLLDLLASREATREWMVKFLELKGSGDLMKLYLPPPGNIGVVPMEKYVCPQGDYVWYRRNVAIPVPACPTHAVELGPAK